MVNSQVGDHVVVKHTTTLLSQLPLSGDEGASTRSVVQWRREGDRVCIRHSKPVQQVCWHVRGDYLASVTADGKAVACPVSNNKGLISVLGSAVCIHQLSKARSQVFHLPFIKLILDQVVHYTGAVQEVERSCAEGHLSPIKTTLLSCSKTLA